MLRPVFHFMKLENHSPPAVSLEIHVGGKVISFALAYLYVNFLNSFGVNPMYVFAALII